MLVVDSPLHLLVLGKIELNFGRKWDVLILFSLCRFWIEEVLRPVAVAAVDVIGGDTVLGFTGSWRIGAVGNEGLLGKETGGLVAAPALAASSLLNSTGPIFREVVGSSCGIEMYSAHSSSSWLPYCEIGLCASVDGKLGVGVIGI